MTFSLYKNDFFGFNKIIASMLFVFIVFYGGAQYTVNFEGVGETKTGYASGNVTLSGIQWNMTEALIGTEAGEVINGSRTARLRGYGATSMTMNANKSNGIGTISFNYKRYGTDNQVAFMVEYSTDNGSTWTQAGGNFTAPGNNDIQTFSATVNVSGNIRIRIRTVSDTGTTNRRLNIDDITVTDYVVSNTITTGAITGAPFSLANCSSTASGSVAFTSTGTFTAGNVYTAQLSSPGGSFASPISIGTLSSTSNSGTINFTLPAGVDAGTYRVRVVSSNPYVEGTVSATFTVTSSCTRNDVWFQGFENASVNCVENWGYTGGVRNTEISRDGTHSARVGRNGQSNTITFDHADIQDLENVRLELYHSVRPGSGPGMDTREGAVILVSLNNGAYTAIARVGGFGDHNYPFSASQGGSSDVSAECDVYQASNPVVYNVPAGTNTVSVRVVSVVGSTCSAFNTNMTNATAGNYDRDDEGFHIDDVRLTTTSEFLPGYWVGGVSTDWHDCMNWHNRKVPTATTDAIIPQTAVKKLPCKNKQCCCKKW
jgi:hypothetical protein